MPVAPYRVFCGTYVSKDEWFPKNRGVHNFRKADVCVVARVPCTAANAHKTMFCTVVGGRPLDIAGGPPNMYIFAHIHRVYT